MQINKWTIKRHLRAFSVFLGLFIGASMFFYLLLNGGAYWKEMRYWIFLQSPFSSPDLKTGEILGIANQLKLPPGSNFKLIVPSLEIETPVVSPGDSSTNAILASMEDGVALYPGSVDPGSLGRAVMLGHSSRASWYRGNYATVFALIPKLIAGDKIYIVSSDKKYTYQVFSETVMTPADTNIFLASEPNDSEITLITCYPIGSASKRNVVQAKLIGVEPI